MRYCAFCANEVTDAVESCPFCGKRMPKPGGIGAAKEAEQKGAAIGGEAHGAPITYPLPAAGEGATVRGFAPVTPAPPNAGPAHHVDTQLAWSSDESGAPTAADPPPTAPPPASEVTGGFGAPADGAIVPPAITMPVEDGPGGLAPATLPLAPDHAPAPPAEEEHGEREQAAIDSGVGPMPPAPLGLMGCLPYVFAVMSARRLRAATIRGLHVQIEGEKQKIHDALRDLGQAARRSANPPTIARQEIDRLIALEEDRGQAEAAKGALEAQLAAEEDRFVQSERGHRSTAEAHRAELTAAQGDLSQVDAEINRHRQALSELQRQADTLEKERQNAETRAQKASDEAEREVLIRSAAEKDVALDDIAQKKGAAETAMATASGPRAALEQRVSAAQAGLERAQAAIEAARQELESRRKLIDEERRHGGMQVTQLEREIMHAQVVVGGVLDSHRPSSDDGSFEEHYGQVDSHRRITDEKMRQISALDVERDAYDQGAHKRGLILLGSIVGLLALTVLIVVLLV